MEPKFEILSYNNCKDLKRAVNHTSVIIGAASLLAGLYIAMFVSVNEPTSNLNMLRLAAGWMLTGFGIVMLVFNPRRWVYASTGSPVRRRQLEFGMEQLPKLRSLLEGTDFDGFAVRDVSRVHIDCYASADRKFAAIQVLQYGTMTEIPLTPAGYLHDGQAETFLKTFASIG